MGLQATKTIEEKVFDILATTTVKHPPEVVLKAARIFAGTGNATRAAKEAGIAYDAITYWKSRHWFTQILELCKVEQQKLLDVKLTGLLENVIEHIEDRLENGDWNHLGTRHPVTMKTLLQALTVLYDKRALIRGEPTSRIERVSTEQRLNKLSRRFAELPKKAKDFITEGIEEDVEHTTPH